MCPPGGDSPLPIHFVACCFRYCRPLGDIMLYDSFDCIVIQKLRPIRRCRSLPYVLVPMIVGPPHTREALVSAYMTVAGLLKLPESDAKDQTLAADAVKRWLGSHEGWLLILDNADDLEMARRIHPAGKRRLFAIDHPGAGCGCGGSPRSSAAAVTRSRRGNPHSRRAPLLFLLPRQQSPFSSCRSPGIG